MTSEKSQTGQGSGVSLVRRRTLGGKLRGYLLAGVLVTAPLGVTALLAWWIITFIDERVTPLIPAQYNPESYLPFSLPGLGLVVLIIFLSLIGALTAGFLGRWVILASVSLIGCR